MSRKFKSLNQFLSTDLDHDATKLSIKYNDPGYYDIISLINEYHYNDNRDFRLAIDQNKSLAISMRNRLESFLKLKSLIVDNDMDLLNVIGRVQKGDYSINFYFAQYNIELALELIDKYKIDYTEFVNCKEAKGNTEFKEIIANSKYLCGMSPQLIKALAHLTYTNIEFWSSFICGIINNETLTNVNSQKEIYNRSNYHYKDNYSMVINVYLLRKALKLILGFLKVNYCQE